MSAGLALVDDYARRYPDEVARHLERQTAPDAAAMLTALPPDSVAALLPHLATTRAAVVLADLPADTAGAVAGRMPVDTAASLLRLLAPDVVSRILAALPAEQARGIEVLLEHEPTTAAGVMDPHVLTVPLAASVAETRALLATTPAHVYYYVYVVDPEHRLAGVFDLAELMQADADLPLRAIVTPHVTWLAADAPLESVFAHPGWRAFDAMPVVDADRRFLGVLRHRRMRQLRERETETDGDDRAVRTMMALGEVYWLGLAGLLQGIAATASESAATGPEVSR